MEEAEFISIEVGKEFPLFQESCKMLKGTDGAHFEASDFNQGYMFCIHLAGINFMDKQAFRNEKIEMRILQGDYGMVLPMIKFGKALTFEMTFDPTLYDDERALQFTETNNMLILYLIESNSNVLKAIRKCNLPLKMIQICKEAWSRAMLEVNHSEKFKEWCARLSNYPLQTLWDRSTKVGELGETYDLQDIKIPQHYKPNNEII